MTGDNLRVVDLKTEDFTHAFGDITMTCAVETIATHVVFLIEFVGNGIEISIVGHSAVECIVKDTNLRSGRHEGINCTDALQMSCVMNRCKVAKFFDTFLYLLCKDNAFVKLVAALHDAMSYGINLVEALDSTEFGVEQALEHQRNAFLMRGEVGHDLFLLTIW